MSGHDGRYLRDRAAVAGLVVVNLGLWGLITIAPYRQIAVRSAYVALTIFLSTITVALVLALWRTRLSGSALAIPALRQMLATHQAGHIVAAHVTDPSRIRNVTLSGGCNPPRSVVTPSTETALRSEMLVILGGAVAEELFAGESAAHAAADLARATDIAINMVGRYGMTESPVSLASATRGRREFTRRVLDDARTRKDLETLLRAVKQDTVRTILENRHLVVELRDALLRHNRLSDEQIRTIVAGADRRRRDDDKVLVDLRVVGNRAAAEARS